MGLEDEIAQEIRQATKRNPWLLDLAAGFEVVEPVGNETVEDVMKQIALVQRLLMLQADVSAAHRRAILRLAREIDSQKES